MHKYTELLTYLTKIRISEYKYIQGIDLHGVQFAYRPRSNRDFSQSFNIFSKCKALAEAKLVFSTFNTGSLPLEQTPSKNREGNRQIVAKNAKSDTTS